MTSHVLELIELKNGDVVLRRADEPEEALVTISFSDVFSEYVDGIKLAIAKEMIQAGSNAYADIVSSEVVEDGEGLPSQPIIH